MTAIERTDETWKPIRAWETATSLDIDTPFGRQPRTLSPKAIPWTDEERDLWRRAEAGEEFAPPVPEEEEPVSDFAPKSVDDLAGPALARLRELASQVEKAEALAHSLRAEALRFVQVLDVLGIDFPEQLRVIARAKASPLAKTTAPVPEGERWACACGFRSVGRYAGRHPERCPLKRAARAG